MKFKHEGNLLKSGIYKITNTINQRIYIGSTKLFKIRHSQHTYALRKQRHSNKFLQADFNKCGEDAFIFELIEITDGKTKEERLLIEEKYLEKYYDSCNTCYNFVTKATSSEGHSFKNLEETKRKMSESQKLRFQNNPELRKQQSEKSKINWQHPEYIEKMRPVIKKFAGWNRGIKMPEISGEKHPNYGKHHSEESKNKMKESLKGRIPWNKGVYGYTSVPCSEEKKEKLRKANIGKIISDEAKEKISRNRKGKNAGKNSASAKVYEGFQLLSPNGTIYTKIECLTDFTDEHGLNMKCLWKLLKGLTPSTRGWTLANAIKKQRDPAIFRKGEKHPMYGKRHTDESKNKIRLAKIGKMEGMEHPNAKIYQGLRLLSPDGAMITDIDCLASFCRQNDLEPTRLCAVLNGRRKSTKGWKLASDNTIAS
jgi:group I intron endonuclease